MKEYLFLATLFLSHLSLQAQTSNSSTNKIVITRTQNGAASHVACTGTYDAAKNLIKLTEQDDDAGKLLCTLILYYSPEGRIGRVDKLAPNGSLTGVLIYFDGYQAKAFDKNGNPANLEDWKFQMTDIDIFTGALGETVH